MWRGIFIGLVTAAAIVILSEAKKAGWRFSLKLLFFTMTLVAVTIGVVVWDVRSGIAYLHSLGPRD